MKNFLAFFFVVSFSCVFSQVTEFSSVSSDFPQEVENFIKDYDKSLAKTYAKKLEEVWGVYTEEQKQTVVAVANKMLEKKVKLKPHFLHYFSSISNFGTSSNYSSQGFKNWTEVVSKLLEYRNKKRFEDFIEFSDPFFRDLTLAKSTSVRWEMTGSYSFYEKNGGFLKIEEARISAFSKNDSTVIIDAKGSFNVSSKSFMGKSGTVTWERVELPANETFAELSRYRINMKSAGYAADSVVFYSPYFETPKQGKLREKVLTFTTISNARYPLFTSYSQDILLKNIAPNVNYIGQFTLEGNRFKGGTTGENSALISIQRNNKDFVNIESKSLDILENEIKCRAAKVTFFLNDTNTLTQNLCEATYSLENRLLTVFKNQKSPFNYPFLSTYHQMAFYVDRILWKEGSNELELGSFETIGKSIAAFESMEYFSRKEFNSFKLGNTNLLKSIFKFQGGAENEVPVSISEFATFNKVLVDELMPYLTRMANKGLIVYSDDRKEVFITDRAEPYLFSSYKDGDYDDVLIQSAAKNKNGSINLNTLSLSIEGIKNFNLSKKQFVRVYPKLGKVVVNKNRNISFDGVINAGRTECFGSNLEFDYTNFTLNFLHLDSLRFRVYSMHDSIQSPQVRLLTKLSNLVGNIAINSPNNRSGSKPGFEHYPVLSVNNSPRIYYNQSQILNGIYDTSNFYFELIPFEMDSLLTFSNESLRFDGSIFTAEIFPSFPTSVWLMNDYVLGFELENISEKIYSGKADYNEILKLNRDGLVGKGKFGFLTSSAYSSKITFFPDSMVAKTGQYTNKSQTLPSVPDIVADNCLVNFQPRRGIWKAKNLDVAMNIFADGKSQFDGNVVLQESGMTGNGQFISERIQVNSKSYKFKQNGVDADEANFILTSTEKNDPPALEANNLKMSLDLENRLGSFIANSGTETIEFPANKFTATTDEFEWFMDENKMTFKQTIDTANFQNYDENNNLKPNFVSSLKAHKGLGFFSSEATYVIDSNILSCQNIPYVVLADARIIPSGGVLTIKEKAEIPTLYNAQIIANFINQYHRFTQAEVSIFSKDEYLANGNYIVSQDTTMNSKVFFDNIEPNSDGTTIAKGKIDIEADFYLSPQFKYFGDILVKGSDVGATYNGQTKVVTNCEELELDWIQFQAIVDTNKIIIPLNESFADKVSGPIMYNDGEVSLYTAFLAEKKRKDDQSITPSEGFLSFNKEKGLFEIGTKDKLLNNKAPGNYVSFDNENCSFKSIGELNLFANNDQFSLDIIGELSSDKLRDTTLKMNGTMKVSFPFNDGVVNQMSKEIADAPFRESIGLDESNYDLFLNQVLPSSELKKINQELFTMGRISKIPQELNSVITLYDLDFYWDEELQSFLSVGNANVATIGENQLYKRCKVYVQIQKRKSGDKFALLVEYKEDSFYYFDYFNGELLSYSTDKTYMELLEKIPAKDKKIKGGKGQGEFYFGTSSKSKPFVFLDNFVKEDSFDED